MQNNKNQYEEQQNLLPGRLFFFHFIFNRAKVAPPPLMIMMKMMKMKMTRAIQKKRKEKVFGKNKERETTIKRDKQTEK